MPLPLAAVGIATVGQALAGISMFVISKVGDQIIDAIVGDTPKSALDYAKVQLMRGKIYDWTFDFMKYPISADTSYVVSGISDESLVEWMIKAVELTTLIGMFVGNEVAEEMLMEMIQEAWSQSVQATVGGALLSIFSYYRGSYPVQQGEIDRIMEIWEDIDEHLRTWLLATTGEHIYTLIYRILLGFKRRLDEDYRNVQAQIPVYLEKCETLVNFFNLQARDILQYHYTRVLNSLLDSVDRLIIMGDNIMERVIGRINEIEMDLDAHKRLYNHNVISPDTFLNLINHQVMLLDATRDSYNTMMNFITSSIDNMISSFNIPDVKTYIDNVLRNIYERTCHVREALKYDYDLESITKAIDTVSVLRQYGSPEYTSPATPAVEIPAVKEFRLLDVAEISLEDMWTYRGWLLLRDESYISLTDAWEAEMTYSIGDTSSISMEDIWGYATHEGLTLSDSSSISLDDMWGYTAPFQYSLSDNSTISLEDIWVYTGTRTLALNDGSNISLDDAWGYTFRPEYVLSDISSILFEDMWIYTLHRGLRLEDSSGILLDDTWSYASRLDCSLSDSCTITLEDIWCLEILDTASVTFSDTWEYTVITEGPGPI